MQQHDDKVSLRIDMRLVIGLLLLIIVGLLVAWHPWDNKIDTGRTVTVTGEAKITAEPDEYTFSPTYDFKETNKEAALAALSAKSDEIVKKLKELGVASSKIKTNADGYDYRNYYYDETVKQYTYSFRPVAVVGNKSLAQKVQDYLLTTSPSGQVTPMAGFSTTMRKSLESKARDEATRDARSKADQSAKNLGFSVAKVKSVQDGGNLGGVINYGTPMMAEDAAVNKRSASIAVQPGENDLTYSVTVVYFVK